MKPKHYYFLGSGSWFFAYGIQSVMFAWLVTIVLHESPDLVGIAQMTFLIPAVLFMLIGGSLADYFGGKTIAIYGQTLAALSILFLITSILLDEFSYPMLLIFAIGTGCAQALVTPARDGLLPLIADGRIQRRVVQVSMSQFGLQMLGFLAASFADRTGATIILSIQFVSILIGVVAFVRMRLPETTQAQRESTLLLHLIQSIKIGMDTVRNSQAMLTVVILNCAVGLFFMGSYIVTMPLLVRELHDGTSVQLAMVNSANAIGILLTTFCMLYFGDIHRQGRALMLSSGIGSLVLATAGLDIGFPALIASVFSWGLCGGMGMTMSRIIMQELAPPSQRARIMAFFSFSFMGVGTFGALFNGYMVQWFGAANTIMICSCCMFVVILITSLITNLWQLDSSSRQA